MIKQHKPSLLRSVSCFLQRQQVLNIVFIIGLVVLKAPHTNTKAQAAKVNVIFERTRFNTFYLAGFYCSLNLFLEDIHPGELVCTPLI